MRKVAIHNLGCKVNSYEAESMEIMLKNAGYQIVPFSENIKADVYIINTCSVTNIADRKSRQMLHKAKKMNPEAVVVACGCYVQADPDKVREDTCVDIIIGNNMKINIVEALEQYFEDKNSYGFLVDINDKLQEYEGLTITETGEHTRAYIKIQDGCNQFCSYCIIPYVRGRVRSRKPEDIINEVTHLAKNGVKEVVFTGIHISSYGTDLGEIRLFDLLKAANDIEGIERIRLGSLEPRLITEAFLEQIKSIDKLCPHFHLSLQSGCDKTLKAMNRKYTTAEYKAGCDLLRKHFDNPAITTDVIVGFPGETEEDFEITKSFLSDICFYEMHIFKYSRRKGTVADKMDNQIPDEVKTKRSSILLELESRQSRSYREKFLNNELEILVEEPTIIDGNTYYTGYTKNYIRVAVLKEKFSADPVNSLVRVKPTHLNDDKTIIIGDLIM